MWSTPSTTAQEDYFSKHAAKRRVYGIIQTLLQALHGFLAFAAWFGIFQWAFIKAPVLQPTAPYLAVLLLLAFHLLFRVTWSTYWYDKLDDDKNTDSSPWIPLLIVVVLIVTEAQGARIFLQGQVDPPSMKTDSTQKQSHQIAMNRLESQYKDQVSRIENLYKEQQQATALPYNSRITALRRRKIDSDAERKAIYNQIAAQERARDQEIAEVLNAKANALGNALNTYNADLKEEKDTHRDISGHIATSNRKEETRYETDMASAGTASWLISIVLLALIMALGYAIVRINVKSGILPRRNFTILDAHGSMIERIWTALSDAFNRRSLQLAVSIHRGLSPSEALRTFDGRVVAMPGTYNSPEGMFTEKNTPAPPSDSELIGEAWGKVFAKLERLRGVHPGYMPGRAVLNNEMNKAMTMNGSYAGAAWDDPDLLGKP